MNSIAVMPQGGKVSHIALMGWQFTVAWADRAHVVLKEISEAIGLSWGAQVQRIKTTTDRFNYVDIDTVAEDGKSRSMICLPVAELGRWLDGINPNKLSDEVRTRLEAMKAAFFDTFIGQTLRQMMAERDEARAWVSSYRAEWLAQKRIRSKVLALVQDGLSFPAIWQACHAPKHLVVDTLRALREMEFITDLPAGTVDQPRQLEMFSHAH